MERASVYRRKLDVIVQALAKLPAPDFGAPTSLSLLEKEGVFHVVQVSIDAALDIAAMLVKDAGDIPADDYHNLDTLVRLEVIPPTLADRLRQLNGLRNAIVHKYNAFEEERVFESLDEIGQALLEFVDVAEARR